MGALKALVALVLAALAAAPATARGLPEGSRYVALGSSYAAGPGVGDKVPDTPARCSRSSLSYSRVLARQLKLDLVDASCGGATTANVLAPWKELPAQIDSLTPDTRLVTITVGGNDVRFVGNLAAGACAIAKAAGQPAYWCPTLTPPTEAEWRQVEVAMGEIAREVRHRSPRARLIFVDYATIVPAEGTCLALGVSETSADLARAAATRLAALTARVAKASGAG